MKLSAVTDRLRVILETDWKQRAAELLESKAWQENKEGRVRFHNSLVPGYSLTVDCRLLYYDPDLLQC